MQPPAARVVNADGDLREGAEEMEDRAAASEDATELVAAPASTSASADEVVAINSDAESDLEDDEKEKALVAKLEALQKKKEKLEKGSTKSRAQALKEKNAKYRWGTYLIVSPFAPAALALATVVVGGVVLNYYPKSRRKTCGSLDTFVGLAMGLSYTLLFLLSYLFVGPKPFRSFKQLKVAYGALGALSLGLYAIGTLWWLSAFGNKDGPCNNYGAGGAPGLLYAVTAFLGAFYVALLVIALFAVRDCRRALKERREEVAREEQEAAAEKALKEEMRREKKEQKKALAKQKKEQAQKEKEEEEDRKAKKSLYGDSDDD